MKTKTIAPQRMSYETYAYLISLVEDQFTKLEREYHRACFFIPPEPYRKGRKSSLDKAYDIFMAQCANLRKVKDELLIAARATYKDHPNPEMRKFWGLEE